MTGRPPSPLRARAVALLRAGRTPAEVARETGAPLGSVGRWAHEARVVAAPRRGPAVVPPLDALPVLEALLQRRAALEAGEPAESKRALAQRLGLHEATVRGWERRWLSDG